MGKKPNFELRLRIKELCLTNYSIAEKLGVSISTFYVMLQRSLTDEQRGRIEAAIEELSAETATQSKGATSL